jgi:hypothetical protein
MPNDDMEGSSSRIAFFPCEIWKVKMVQILCSCKLQFVLKENKIKKSHMIHYTTNLFSSRAKRNGGHGSSSRNCIRRRRIY